MRSRSSQVQSLDSKGRDVGSIGLKYFALAAVCIVANACVKPTVTEKKSPNGNATLIAKLHDPGAAGTSRYKVYLKAGSQPSATMIFDGKGGWPVDIEWKNDSEIIVKSCKTKKLIFRKYTEIVDKIAIKIHVVDLDQGYNDQFFYCP